MTTSTPLTIAEQGAERRRSRARGSVSSAWGAVAATVLILWLTRLLFLDHEHFINDFYNDAWYIDHQVEALRSGHLPSLYLTAPKAAFYPIFAFYGGTLFAVIAAFSMITGVSAATAQALAYAVALGAAYGGWYWLARLAGVRSWIAHAPGLVYVTAPYVVTNMYARQDLVETVATAAMPLMVATAISAGRADRLRPGRAAALAASTIAFTGSHNLTLLWGTAYLAIAAAVVLAAVPAARHLLTRRGVLRIAAVVVPAVAVNAWFLLPDLVYANHTAIAQRVEEARGFLRTRAPELSLGHLLTPARPDDAQGAGYTLPILALTWTLVAVVAARRGVPGRAAWRRVWAIMAVATLAIAVLMSQAHVLAGLPDVFAYLQSGIRLDTYALFSLCAALIAAAAVSGRPSRLVGGLLAAVLAVGVVQAAVQIGHVPMPPPIPDVDPGAVGTFGLGDYADATRPIIQPPPGTPVTTVTAQDVERADDRAQLSVQLEPGDMFLTNLMGPASLLKVDGARIVGRWTVGAARPGWQKRWYLVLQVPPTAKGSVHRVTIAPASTLPIVAGRVLSLLGLLGLPAVAIAAIWPRARRRASPPPSRPRGAAADGTATPERG